MSFWNEDNASAYVIAVMRLLFKACPLDRKDFVSEAHSKAEKAKTLNQPQYDLAFGRALIELLVASGRVSYEEVTDEALQGIKPVATISKSEPVKNPEKPAFEGPSFKPATARIEPLAGTTLQLPELRLRKSPHAAPTYSRCEDDEAPWGVSARSLASWAWAKLGERKMSKSKANEIAQVLSVLYYAGLIKEGALTPIGMVRRKQTRAPKVKGLHKCA